jgi:restriction endonuclease Mrr
MAPSPYIKRLGRAGDGGIDGVINLHLSESIVLLDGTALTRLMIEHGVAVTHHRVIRLQRIDQDYFQ